MIFQKVDKYFEHSDCNRFTICAHNSVLQPTFLAYRRSESPFRTPATLLGTYATAEEARERCRQAAQEAAA